MKRAALLKLVQWLSPSYPVGAFSYSHGLEWAISQGEVSNPAQLCNWLTDILTHGAGRNDAIFLAHAYRADTPAALAEIAELAVAFGASKERLLETTAQGAAFAKVTRAVWPADLPDMPYPVAMGAATRQHDLPLEDTTALYLHAFTANLVSAAVRFMPLGQTDGQSVLSSMAGIIDQTAEAALGAGKTSLTEALCKAMRDDYSMAVITNDIYTREDAEYLMRSQALPLERIKGVETGGCPHTALREDASINLAAIDDLNKAFPDLDLILILILILIESGGDNLSATFSPELADLTIYVIDVAAGEDIPRKGGPAITRSDLLVINKTDLAPYVGASLEVMARDSRKMRGVLPLVFCEVKNGKGVKEVVAFIKKQGGL